MPDNYNTLLISRYLVEDPGEAFLVLDLDQSQDEVMVSCIFKTLV